MATNFTDSQLLGLSKDFDTEGFDLQAGKTWIYPTNYPTRDYQYNIIEKALLKNTLVSLPTGLGKTFIAAVVMYNFYRWYPQGKIIFMAPTKPLVKQQVDACYNIMAIPPDSTAELTGAKASASRTDIWKQKRVFFITPQILQNDLNSITELGEGIKCLVFDEAHKARGNHAYCEVIRRLVAQNHKYFRVLALSATPGNNVNDVLEVIQNLMISHLEFRTEESIDVHPYVYQRSLETIVVPLGNKLQEVKDEYLNILEYYVKTLRKFNVIQGNCGSLTKGKIFMLMKDFQNKCRGTKSSNYSEIMRCLNICVTLYHAYELLIKHGLRNFLSFFDEHIEKPLLKGNTQIRSILNNVRDYLGPIPNVEVLPDGTYPEIPTDIVFGHPKYYKLRDVLVSHFTGAGNTRVIVFFEYRESVMEAHTLLLQSRPLIQPMIFLGQGSGVTQKIQIGVVKAFREGRCNTLLSTCIGEEGLDVGEVDLIVCFDISSKSPIRMVQRMGRTGRKREGKVLVLVTEGKEQQTLKDCLIHKNNISTFVLGSKQLCAGMYNESPRLVPNNLTPKCEKIFITVKKLEKKKSIKDMLRSISSSSSELVFSQNLQITDIPSKIPKRNMYFMKDNNSTAYQFDNMFSKYIDKQRTIHKPYMIGSSRNTKLLTNLLSWADSKRFNIPTQIQLYSENTSQRNLKQGDIRNMFVKVSSQNDFQMTQKYNDDISTQFVETMQENYQETTSESCNVPKEVFEVISSYVLSEMNDWESKCKHCPPGLHEENLWITVDQPSTVNNNIWIPSEDILDTISLSDLKVFHNSLLGHKMDENDDDIIFCDDLDSQIFENIDIAEIEKEKSDQEQNGSKEDTDRSVNFEAPKSFIDLLDKFGESIIQDPSQNDKLCKNLNFSASRDISERENGNKENTKHSVSFDASKSLLDKFGEQSPQNDTLYKNYDASIGLSENENGNEENTNQSVNFEAPKSFLSLVDKFGESIIHHQSQNEMLCKNNNNCASKNLSEKELLKMFNLDSLEDLFGNTTIETSEETVIYSPTVSNIDALSDENEPTSPVITSSYRERAKKRIMRKSKHQQNNTLNSSGNCEETENLSIASLEKSTDLFHQGDNEVNINQNCITLNRDKESENLNVASQRKSEDLFIEGDSEININQNYIDDEETQNLNVVLDQSQKKSTDIFLKEENIIRDNETESFCFKLDSSQNENTTNLENFDVASSVISYHNKQESVKQDSKACVEDKSITEEYSAFRNSTFNINEICDLSYFGLSIKEPKSNTKREESETEISQKDILDISEICDLAEFGIVTKSPDRTPDITDIEQETTMETNMSPILGNTKSKVCGPKKMIFDNKVDDVSDDDLEFILPSQIDRKILSNAVSVEDQLPRNIQNSTNVTVRKKRNVNNDLESQKTNSRSNVPKGFRTITRRHLSFNDSDDDFETPIYNVNRKPSPLSKINKKHESFEKTTKPKKSPKDCNKRKRLSNNEDADVSILQNNTSLELSSFDNSKHVLSSTNNSDLSITQMLSLINKSSQKENVRLSEKKVVKNSHTTPVHDLSIFDNLANYEEFSSSFIPPVVEASSSKKRSENSYLYIDNGTNGNCSKILDNRKISSRKNREETRSSVDDFDDFHFLKPPVPGFSTSKSKTHEKVSSNKKKKKPNEFLDLEAELSEDESVFISDDEREENIDCYEGSFVNDESQYVNTEMHAKYLQSLRSPVNNRAKFKIHLKPAENVVNVFSQPVEKDIDNYLEDSFCVDADDEELSQNHELSELEVLERKLKEQKKRKKSQEHKTQKPKRRRIMQVLSDDSD
ncbi:uncharacterized protein LOC115886430 [Sitophilus oryzae]|uniref:Uncharacterized protein LOC115886430 n=1 Tax=Sitophilus oryzae TaxID=7048 RepID=A0A6J2YC38_SITOR|nr:uncharacterized protein LOC115886430 [Sitophilus oryzae]